MDKVEREDWFSQNDYHYKISVDSEGEFLREGVKHITLLSSGAIGLMLTMIATIAPDFLAEPLIYCAGFCFVMSLIALLLYNFLGKECCVYDQEVLRNLRERMIMERGDSESAKRSSSAVSEADQQAQKRRQQMTWAGCTAILACVMGIVFFSVFGAINIHRQAVVARRAAHARTAPAIARPDRTQTMQQRAVTRSGKGRQGSSARKEASK